MKKKSSILTHQRNNSRLRISWRFLILLWCFIPYLSSAQVTSDNISKDSFPTIYVSEGTTVYGMDHFVKEVKKVNDNPQKKNISKKIVVVVTISDQVETYQKETAKRAEKIQNQVNFIKKNIFFLGDHSASTSFSSSTNHFGSFASTIPVIKVLNAVLFSPKVIFSKELDQETQKFCTDQFSLEKINSNRLFLRGPPFIFS